MRTLALLPLLSLVSATAWAAPARSASLQPAPIVAAAATADLPSFDAKLLKGTWTDEGGTKYWFSGGSQPKLKKIVDSDGEVFQALWSGWSAGAYQFVYRVPSTAYIVVITIDGIANHVADTSWVNDHMMSGTEQMFQN